MNSWIIAESASFLRIAAPAKEGLMRRPRRSEGGAADADGNGSFSSPGPAGAKEAIHPTRPRAQQGAAAPAAHGPAVSPHSSRPLSM